MGPVSGGAPKLRLSIETKTLLIALLVGKLGAFSGVRFFKIFGLFTVARVVKGFAIFLLE